MSAPCEQPNCGFAVRAGGRRRGARRAEKVSCAQSTPMGAMSFPRAYRQRGSDHAVIDAPARTVEPEACATDLAGGRRAISLRVGATKMAALTQALWTASLPDAASPAQ